MKYELRHYSYKPTLGGKSVSAENLINALDDRAIHYVGTFSEINPLHVTSQCVIYIRKRWDRTGEIQHPIKLNGLTFKSSVNSAGGGISLLGGFSLNKQDLLRIANAMDETDEFNVSEINRSSAEALDLFKDGIKEVIGNQ